MPTGEQTRATLFTPLQVRLAFVDEDTGLEMLQPTLHTNAVPLKPNKTGYSLLAVACGRCVGGACCWLLIVRCYCLHVKS